ncbi:MAG TPA: hypothetical protein VH044_13715 [Polyangiaceae bacterium]|nr:hypothetical protein [Polyangiaceae bacterium]
MTGPPLAGPRWEGLPKVMVAPERRPQPPPAPTKAVEGWPIQMISSPPPARVPPEGKRHDSGAPPAK